MRVFISSTFQDLVDERDAVHRALDSAYVVVRMEDFGARDEVPLETCLQAVEDSEVYVLLLGHRYGTLVPPDREVSYTHAEYEHALNCRLPVLAYIKHGFDDAVAGADDPARLRDFRAEIERSHTAAKPDFGTPEALAQQVRSDLDRNRERFKVRPVFGQRTSAIEDDVAYSARTVRFNRLQLNPIRIVLADLSVLHVLREPERRGRKLRDKVRSIHSFLQREGANVIVFNDIPATGADPVVEQRAAQLQGRADVIVCIVRGEPDLERLGYLRVPGSRIFLWYPDRLAFDVPGGVRAEPYTPEELQECGLASHIQRFLDGVIDEHLAPTLA